MKLSFFTKTVFTILFSISAFWGFAQSNQLKINLDESGKTYIKASVRAQFWARYMQMNPGTTLNGKAIGDQFDVSIRRIRLGVSAQLTPKLFVFSMFGENNMNMATENKNIFLDVLDLNAEYEFLPQFALGIGEHAWHGLSRWTTRSSNSLMAVDAPLFSLFTVNKNDDLARGLGVWVKGQVAKIDYHFSIQNPTTYGVEAKENKTDYALNNTQPRTGGYVKYEFWDNESNKTAYSGGTGTYLGKKKILNFGGGFIFQPKMMSSLVNGTEEYYDYVSWAAEIFMDTPLNKEKGNAITTYLGYFDTDFGPNYIRNLGANDYTGGGTSFNGSGNDFPMMGTGSTIFFQLGYLMAKNEKNQQFQPNIAIQYSDFEALDDYMLVYDVGINMFMKGHANKLSMNYQGRPIYQTTDSQTKIDEWKGQIVLQYQITIN